MRVTRRDMFKVGGLAAAGAAGLIAPWGAVNAGTPSLLAKGKMPQVFKATFKRLDTLAKTTKYDGYGAIDCYNNSANVGLADIVPGMKTPVMGYQGVVPGRKISVEQGTRVQMWIHNRLPKSHPTFGTPVSISTHLHGSATLPQYDGYASDTTDWDFKKLYHYPNYQVARTLWFHDHGVHFTSQNAYSGLASQYHMHDPRERALLPQGDTYDVGITLSDMMFQANGSQLFDDRSHSGLWGDVILANGAPWPVMRVQKRIYRFRFLNASISRSYRPTTFPAAPMWMVATDGGLMDKPQQMSSWRHGSAERYEVLIDFSGFKAGQRIELRNLSNPNNRDYDFTNKIMAFDVVDDAFDTNDWKARTIPVGKHPGGTDLTTWIETKADGSKVEHYEPNEVMALKETSGLKVRNIRVEHDDVTNAWMLNGLTWEDVKAADFRPVLANPGVNDTEIWEIENKSGGWFHPVHIHLIDFKILSRNGKAPFNYELGPKDVVYVGEGEKVRLLMKFGDSHKPAYLPERTGRYMVHCHNLVHEDHDMMHQFSVGLPAAKNPTNGRLEIDPTASAADLNHPIEADKPCPEAENDDDHDLGRY